MGSGFIQVPTDAWDVLTRQVQMLNDSLQRNHLERIHTEILDTPEAAKYLKVSEKSLQRMRDAGEISFIQRGTMVRYKKSDLDKWVEEHYVC